MSQDENLTIAEIKGIKHNPVSQDIEKANEKRSLTKTENATKLSNHLHYITIFFIYGIAVSIVLMIIAYILSYYIESLRVMQSDIGGWIANIISTSAGFMLSIIYDKTKG